MKTNSRTLFSSICFKPIRLQFSMVVIAFSLTTQSALLFGAPLPSPEVTLETLRASRIQLRDQIEELEKRLDSEKTDPELKNQIRALQKQLTFLASEVIRLDQAQVKEEVKRRFGSSEKSVNPSHPLRSEAEALVLAEFTAKIRRYEANVTLLQKLTVDTAQKLQRKFLNAPVYYDNRHFTFFKKRRPHSIATAHFLEIYQTTFSELLEKFQKGFTSKIESLPKFDLTHSPKLDIKLTNSTLDCQFKAIENLRQDIISDAYLFEQGIENVSSNFFSALTQKEKILKLYRKKLHATYKPRNLNDTETLQFSEAEKKADQGLALKFDETLKSIEGLQLGKNDFNLFLCKQLDQVLDEYSEHAERYVKQKKGTFGYLSEIRKKIDKLFSADVFITLISNKTATPFVTKRPPYPFHYVDYAYLKKFIELQKDKLRRTIETDVEELRFKTNRAQSKETPSSEGPTSVPNENSLPELEAAHRILIKEVYQSILRVVEDEQYKHQAKEPFTQLKNLLSSSDGNKITNAPVLISHADYLQQQFLEHLKNTPRDLDFKKSVEEALHVYNDKIETLSKKISLAKFSIQKDKETLNQTAAQLEKEMMNLSQEIKDAEKTVEFIALNCERLKTFAQANLDYLKDFKNELQIDISAGEKKRARMNIDSDTVDTLQRDINLFTNGAKHLKTLLEKFKIIFAGTAELSSTLRWSEDLLRELKSLNLNLTYPTQLEVEKNLLSFEQQLREIHPILENTVNLIRDTSKRDKGNPLKSDLHERTGLVQRQIESLLKPPIDQIGLILSSLSISYQDLTRSVPLWQIKDADQVVQAAKRISVLMKDRPLLFDSGIVNGWRNFAGYLGLVVADFTQNLAVLDDLAKNLRDIMTNPFQLQLPLESHYVAPFAFANSGSLPGLINFGATCYLNSITKAIETTGLQKLFSPAHPLLKRSDESSSEFALRSQQHRDISLFFSALGNSATYDSELERYHGKALDAWGEILKPKFGIVGGRFVPWMNQQQDAEEALGWILSEFESKEDSFWKLGMGRLSDTRTTSKDNHYVVQWERVLSLGLAPGISSVQSLIQKSLEPTPGSKKTDDGRTLDYLLRERITHAPDTLIIRLNRFDYNASTGDTSKLSQSIDFMSDLHLFESEIERDESGNPVRFHDKQENIRYQIRGVVFHLGSSLRSGHYMYASFESNGDVILHNDTHVTRYENIKSFKDLGTEPDLRDIGKNAYILFFERIK